MTLAEIRDWLKTMDLAEHYYVGRLDSKREKSLGVYALSRQGSPPMALGGPENGSYGVKYVSLLLHWNRNAAETETAAERLWDGVAGAAHRSLPGGGEIQYCRPLVPAPVSVDADGSGVYEYVIELQIYYRR